MADVLAWIFVEIIGASFLKLVKKLKNMGVPDGLAEFTVLLLAVAIFILIITTILKVF